MALPLPSEFGSWFERNTRRNTSGLTLLDISPRGESPRSVGVPLQIGLRAAVDRETGLSCRCLGPKKGLSKLLSTNPEVLRTTWIFFESPIVELHQALHCIQLPTIQRRDDLPTNFHHVPQHSRAHDRTAAYASTPSDIETDRVARRERLSPGTRRRHRANGSEDLREVQSGMKTPLWGGGELDGTERKRSEGRGRRLTW